MERMIEALKLLACRAVEQIAALPHFVVAADEIALLFEEQLRSLNPDACNAQIRAELDAVDRQLSSMSEMKSLWTVDALRTDAEWESLRTSAAEVLADLGVALTRPDLSWVTYVTSEADA